MATQTKVRAGSAARKAQRLEVVEETFPLTARLRAVGRGFSSLMPDLVVSDRLRREITAVVLFLVALLSAWVLGNREADGSLVTWWGNTLRAVCGQGAFLVPILLLAIAFRAFRTQEGPILLPRHYLGGAAFGLAIVGFFQLAAEQSAVSDGGQLGLAVATLLRGALGQVGAGLVLLVAGAFGVFLLADTDVLTLYRDLRVLWPAPSEDEFEELEEEPVAVVALPAKTVKPQARPEIPPAAPVINIPKAEPKPAPATSTSTLPKVAPVAPGEPMPLPDVARLAYYETVSLDTVDLEAKARLIEHTLASFKVEARVREINPGPAVTQYTLEPGVGIKVRRITELQNDLALALAAPSIRIEAPVPGMARVGLEIPNAQVATVGLRETLESPQFARSKAKLPVPLGRDVNGRYVIHDLTKMPHLLIAGATGAGKSVGLNAIISTFLLTRGPDELKMVMIDPKMVELVGYNGVPHLQCPVVTEMDKVVGALRLVVQEMQRRYDLFAKNAVRNIDGYRLKITDEPGAERIPYLVVILDELADLMMTSPDEVETLLCRLTQMGRAAGIHLIIATQRPSVDVLTGLIKANVPARIAFAVTSLTDSRVVLDMPGAERLLGRGDMLFMPPDAAKPQRIQGAFIEDKDVQYVVGHWHAVAPIPQYAKEWMELPSSNAVDEEGEDDPMMEKALGIVREQGTASASMLQRRLRIGYNRAARLIERMEDEGHVGPADGLKGRPFLGGDY
ncbi:MAG: segregation ATPase FtsK/SpoIIIE, family [Thermomicrobiales bacterium]|jgi:S-DNA-T family DNA segregation ATPase FtsK/SpoIIIE|nr:segregation ATPase FtsK/SpoIIIE, family [Thermomicrobiales bacterium]MEA2594553.1 segregation ATPase FtsK/SpoIIIE, family [Thermomicrobiales bacterium]